ncbi:metallophosphoesterase family protein [Porticoccus sp.]
MPAPLRIDPQLVEFASDPQRTKLEAVIETGSVRKAAVLLGINKSSVAEAIQAVQRKAAAKGFAPDYDMTHPVADGFLVKGTSTLYRDDGSIGAQWVKTRVDDVERQRLLQEACEASAEQFKGIVAPIAKPKERNSDLMTVYPMGDPHIGMYSWSLETGHDFDCDIAERDLTNAVAQLVNDAPASSEAVILNLGDFFHSDNQSNMTARSGNLLDVDTRWGRVYEIGINTMRQCIESALRKHQTVYVYNLIGNHDDHTSQSMSYYLKGLYERNKRVTVCTSPSHYRYHRFGKNLIGMTHGDKAKMDKLPLLMATHQKEAWGESDYYYWYTGHIHHVLKKEIQGCLVESFRTLAAPDAWHASMGYGSGRDICAITLHRQFGEVGRITNSLEAIRARMAV